jgi:hypothetical protein
MSKITYLFHTEQKEKKEFKVFDYQIFISVFSNFSV